MGELSRDCLGVESLHMRSVSYLASIPPVLSVSRWHVERCHMLISDPGSSSAADRPAVTDPAARDVTLLITYLHPHTYTYTTPHTSRLTQWRPAEHPVSLVSRDFSFKSVNLEKPKFKQIKTGASAGMNGAEKQVFVRDDDCETNDIPDAGCCAMLRRSYGERRLRVCKATPRKIHNGTRKTLLIYGT